MRLLLGDCLDKLKELDDNSVDSIVTDPPYGLSFMGKAWDYDVPKKKIWKECMRVLKPGGHLLAFAGSRTYHRMAIRIEDAGFEIRDQIMWIYGSGFPKSRDIGKDIEKIKVGGIKNLKQIGTKQGIKVETGTSGYSYSKEYVPGISMGGKQISGDIPVYEITNEWGGWGTALKPAHEPIVMARKPLSGKTVGNNVLEWGTGGINIDDSRIGFSEEDLQKTDRVGTVDKTKYDGIYGSYGKDEYKPDPQGRFPANVIFDEEAGKILDEQSGISKSTGGRIEKKTGWGEFGGSGQKEIIEGQPGFGDRGGASRFFYCPKTSKTDRNEGLEEFDDKLQANAKFRPNHLEKALEGDSGKPHGRYTPTKNNHPTVKPTDLMLYLIRLVTPKGGTTLDPFMGSGSTGKAAVRGGFDFIGIEREKEYMEIATARIQYEIDNPLKEKTGERIETNKNSQKFW